MAHMVWGDGGFLAAIGSVDFAGGNVVHISSGVSALVLAIYLGQRRGYAKATYRTHNIPFVFLGAATADLDADRGDPRGKTDTGWCIHRSCYRTGSHYTGSWFRTGMGILYHWDPGKPDLLLYCDPSETEAEDR